MADLFPFIDEKKIAIWGWSYGGFTAGMALASDDSEVFKCAASVAPVTDWTYYGEILFFILSFHIYSVLSFCTSILILMDIFSVSDLLNI